MTREVLELGAPSDQTIPAIVDPSVTPPEPPLTTIDRLRGVMPTDRVAGWATTIVITLIAFAIRIVQLKTPNKLVFDETYYAKDAYSLLKHGYERNWQEKANEAVIAGNLDVMQDSAAFVVHPPLAKWLIALGEQAFGMNSFGWRISAVVFGCLMIAVLIRLVRRISRSTLIGGIAGLLLTFDGLHFVMSRIALLDIFVAFFLIAAVACLAADRDWFRERLARYLEQTGKPDLGGALGPTLWVRPWRIAAGISFGLALGCKWNAIYPLAAFALLSLAWDLGARRVAGSLPMSWEDPWPSVRRLFNDGIPAFISLVVVAIPVYVSTWAGWLASTGGWGRDWGQNNPNALSTQILGKPLASLLDYHRQILGFHTGDFINKATHSYDAHPAGWLVLGRVIGIDAVNNIKPGTDGCIGPDNCMRVISGLGTPALWWGAVVALIVAAVLWIGARDWRFGIPIVGVLSTWLPWFQYTERPQFFFYAIIIIPFSVIAVALCLGRILGPAKSGDRRMIGAIATGSFVALVGANFAYIYPILSDQLLAYPKWLARMWFKGWI